MAIYQNLTLYKKEIQKANIFSWERYYQELEEASGRARIYAVLANRMKLH